MRKSNIILFLFLFITSSAIAQNDSSFLLVRTYQGDIADATMDKLDNLYVISSTGQLKKFTPSGDSVIYNEVKRFGNSYSLDVSNPLKIVLLYRNFSTIVVLDRFFATINTIDLRTHSIFQPGVVGLAYDNNLWVFDEYDNKLKKIDDQGNLLLETPDFRTLFNLTIAPQRIISENGLVYLADTANGIFIFDNYGSFKKKIPIVNWQSVAIRNNNIISTDREVIRLYNPATFFQVEQKVPFFKPDLHSFIEGNKLITFSTNTLNIYQLTNSNKQ